MKKFVILTCFVSLVFVSCGVSKADFEALKAENEQLRVEIAILKETDQYYYQSGADEFNKSEYAKTIDWMNKLKLKFPQSPLLSSADKIIADSNAEIKAIYTKENDTLNQLLAKARKSELEEAISMLSDYVSKVHPADLIQSATTSLNTYKDTYEKERTQREIEQSVGIRLTDYSTGWGVHGFSGDQLFTPQMTLKFKNIKDVPISDSIKIKVDFMQTSNNEVFGDDTSYFISYGDTPLQPNYTKTAYINCSVGYRRYFSSYELGNLPSITADIYINEKLYRKIPVKKGYK
jgi:hypothetical protein